MQKAFTLIELLVAVLIIGILAALALPQYKVAVVKSRFATILPVLATIKEAEELYYLANGSYTNDWNALGVDLGACGDLAPDLKKCSHTFILDPLDYNTANIRAAYCPEHLSKGNNLWFSACVNAGDLMYTVWFDHSNNPGVVECTGRTALGQQVCKSMGF